MKTGKRRLVFKEELCNRCGECFHQCLIMQLPREDAKQEINNLINGKESKHVLSKCNTCFSCNLYCPQNANPYQLILERWNDLYKERGAPALYRFVCPTEEPNIWQLLNIFLSNQERKWIHKWMNYQPKPEDKIFLIGNYLHLFSFIIGGSKLLEFFKPVDLIDQWEAGAYLYQGGYLNLIQKIAKNAQEDFDLWNVKDIVVSTDSVEYNFSSIHPEEMGVKYKQNFINFHQWLLKSLNSNSIEIRKAPLNLTVTVHDNCYSKVQGGKYWDPPREILNKCGCEIIEMEHIKKDSLCCGFGAGASWVKNMAIPFDIISQGVKKFQEAENTGAKALVSYCSGCIYLLWATRELIGSKIDIFHLVEIVRMAMGEKLPYPEAHIKRAWDVISIITYQLLLSTFQKNFFIRHLRYDKTKGSYQPNKHILLRIIRDLFKLRILRRIYSKLFQILMPIIKTR